MFKPMGRYMKTRSIFRGHQLKALVLGTALALIAGSVLVAREGDRPRYKDNPDGAAVAQPRANSIANAPSMRMVAVVRSPDAVIAISKGVESVTRPATGVYCIKPDPALGINPKRTIALVSVEYFYSQLNEVMAQWARLGHDCGDDKFGVYTLADRNANAFYSFSNLVGFTIVVP